MRFLMRVYHNKANSDDSYRAQKTLNTAINADPTIVMNRVGPYLFKYADPISKHEEKFFLDNEWNDDVSGDDAMKIIMSIKEVYTQCNEDEREKIMVNVSDMLSHYCEYKMAIVKL